MPSYSTQNSLLLDNLKAFYSVGDRLDTMLGIINGDSDISLRIVDWFATNYAKQRYTVIKTPEGKRLNIYSDYKLKLRAYSKRRFDPFCRWDRISYPYKGDMSIQTTIGQLNFFKWAIMNKVLDYIVNHFDAIEKDMSSRLNTAKKRPDDNSGQGKTRKKREELSINACRSIKKEFFPTEVKLL